MSGIKVDHDRVAVLFQDHREAIVGFLVRRVSCPDVAQDLSQEAYLRLMRQTALPHADNLVAYLYRTAERLAIDFLRYDKRVSANQVPLDEHLECSRPEPETAAILRQQCERLLDAIASLPAQCRHVLLLRKIDELSYADIAGQLGISEKTVQRHLVKAMLHCHRRLNNEWI
ncbi:MAG: RNA polymerase sigma factor [Methylomonas sp.]|nr:RNA polymerase sigma factor [Methylomonas sp.]